MLLGLHTKVLPHVSLSALPLWAAVAATVCKNSNSNGSCNIDNGDGDKGDEDVDYDGDEDDNHDVEKED